MPVDDATREACRFILAYYDNLGSVAPEKFSPEMQHAITMLSAYIREKGWLLPSVTRTAL